MENIRVIVVTCYWPYEVDSIGERTIFKISSQRNNLLQTLGVRDVRARIQISIVPPPLRDSFQLHKKHKLQNRLIGDSFHFNISVREPEKIWGWKNLSVSQHRSIATVNQRKQIYRDKVLGASPYNCSLPTFKSNCILSSTLRDLIGTLCLLSLYSVTDFHSTNIYWATTVSRHYLNTHQWINNFSSTGQYIIFHHIENWINSPPINTGKYKEKKKKRLIPTSVILKL